MAIMELDLAFKTVYCRLGKSILRRTPKGRPGDGLQHRCLAKLKTTRKRGTDTLVVFVFGVGMLPAAPHDPNPSLYPYACGR